MRSAGRLRSRVVRALRVLLPLAALGVLSMLFLLARSPSRAPVMKFLWASLKESRDHTGRFCVPKNLTRP